MDYDLALELKKKGFPQIAGSGRFLIDKRKPYIHNGEIMGDESVDSWASRNAYAPTLSELIEACGEGFRSLTKHVNKVKTHGENFRWGAKSNPHVFITTQKSGKTPEEAVARLWLTLKGKKE